MQFPEAHFVSFKPGPQPANCVVAQDSNESLNGGKNQWKMAEDKININKQL